MKGILAKETNPSRRRKGTRTQEGFRPRSIRYQKNTRKKKGRAGSGSLEETSLNWALPARVEADPVMFGEERGGGVDASPGVWKPKRGQLQKGF